LLDNNDTCSDILLRENLNIGIRVLGTNGCIVF